MPLVVQWLGYLVTEPVVASSCLTDVGGWFGVRGDTPSAPSVVEWEVKSWSHVVPTMSPARVDQQTPQELTSRPGVGQ